MPSVFLAYASADAEVAQRLKEELLARGISVSDGADIEFGRPILAEVRRKVEESEAFVYLASKNSPSSYVRTEIATASAESARENLQILPILIDDDASVPPLLASVGHIRVKDYDLGTIADLIKDKLGHRSPGPDWAAQVANLRAED